MSTFSTDVPTHTIDLARAEPVRWAEVIEAERPAAGKLVAAANQALGKVPEIARWGFAKVYEWTGGLYRGEIEAWAKGLDVSVGTATMLNCLYELSHLPQPKFFGCTAGIRWIEGHGLVHVRTLDWPIPGMGDATRLFRFRQGQREFVSVGLPGQVGVLSGMVPGAYSVTINWAPPKGMPMFVFGPTFFLRDVLETCDSYDAACELIKTTELSTSAFFTVCGIERGQACVIERTRDAAAVRAIGDEPLVQANHHIAPDFAANNEAIREVPPEEEVFSIDGSTKRVNILRDGLAALPAATSLAAAAGPLDVPTVLNSQTCQKMVFCPKSGEIIVWREVG
jgi:hypothetical protein